MVSDRKDYYRFAPGSIGMSACVYCAHNLGSGKCKAFPDGIPDEILLMENDHAEPYEGDQGIQFEPSDPKSLPIRVKPLDVGDGGNE